MALSAPALPTLKDELERKTLEAIEWLFSGRSAGKISAAEYSTALDAVWKAVSGLVGHDTTDLFSAAEPEYKGKVVIKRVLYRMDDESRYGCGLVVVTWRVGEQEVRFCYPNRQGENREAVREFASPKQAAFMVDLFVKRMIANGYEEVAL